MYSLCRRAWRSPLALACVATLAADVADPVVALLGPALASEVLYICMRTAEAQGERQAATELRDRCGMYLRNTSHVAKELLRVLRRQLRHSDREWLLVRNAEALAAREQQLDTRCPP